MRLTGGLALLLLRVLGQQAVPICRAARANLKLTVDPQGPWWPPMSACTETKRCAVGQVGPAASVLHGEGGGGGNFWARD